MEIALPIIALGGLYIISNQSRNDTKFKRENFTNLSQNRNLPNTNNLIQNYPVVNKKQIVDNVNEYVNPNVATDKYFNQNLYEKKVIDGKPVEQDLPQIYSMTGSYVDSNQFKHNNMVPFVGKKVRSYAYKNEMSESILDNMTGSGSQIIKKIEQASLFKPEKDLNFANGTPNNSDFYQSRVNPGLITNNEKPFESIQVGPGLNQGYSSQGSNGFNSGMESRDSWLPKNVDQLRVDTNPKMEYSLFNHEGPAQSNIKQLGSIGRVEKQRPDAFFINTQDRWLTTTGAEKGETLRPIQEMGNLKRADTVINYTSPAVNTQGQLGYAPTEYEKSKRREPQTENIPHCNAIGKGTFVDGDNNLKSHTNYSTNRSTMKQPDTIRNIFGGAIGAVVAPIMDFIRPSRKEETVNNVRVYGEGMGSKVPSNYVINPKDTTHTTIKETTIFSPNFNINNQKEGVYVNTHTPTDFTQRDTTCYDSMGNVGGQNGSMVYNSSYAQNNNDVKSQTIHNRPNQGGMQMFNNNMNVTSKNPNDACYNTRMITPSSVIKMPPSKENYGRTNSDSYNYNKIENDRMQGDLLQAFRSNPYTHSLTSSV